MLIHAASNRTNFETFVYDIEDKKIVGQLINGSPVTLIDRSKLLCVESVYAWSPLKERLVRLVGWISRGRIRLPRPSSQIQRYWLLDLEKHSASRMGDLPQRPQVTFQPSPDFHYGYTSLQGLGLERGVYCSDFKRGSIRKLDHLHGWPSGWWDQRNIMVLATNNHIVLHDVTTEKTSPLIGSERIATFLRDNMIAEDPAKARAFFIWTGRENHFYLTDTHQLACPGFMVIRSFMFGATGFGESASTERRTFNCSRHKIIADAPTGDGRRAKAEWTSTRRRPIATDVAPVDD